MKVLALDIGAGTEDVLLYDSGKKNVENCVKMVLPSPLQIFAATVREATRLNKDLLIKGDTIGGGPFALALRNHVEKGLRVVMTENAAYTVRNDLDQVRELGIEVVGERQPEVFTGETIKIQEVNLERLGTFLAGFNESLSDVDIVAIAVQDHGVSPKGMSDRRFRIRKMRELLEKDPRPENLAFKRQEIPSCFLRMKSAAKVSKRQLPGAEILVMDTSPAAILGCLRDPIVERADPVLAVNVGNAHTMATVISDGRIIGLLEHHTRLLNPQKIERTLIDFADGELSDEEVFQDDGHGLFFLADAPDLSKVEIIVATGPNRKILSDTDLPVHFAAPAGDVMMTGPMGLVEAAYRKIV
jgi:uncharacterized protein (DUF1786 family)